MREEAKNGRPGGINNPANFQTMPHPPQQAGFPMNPGPMMSPGQGPPTPRHVSQTMNVSFV